MRHLLPVVLLLTATSFSGCQKESEPEALLPTGLVGTWRLVQHQCYCFPASLPNVQVTFTNSDFTFVENNQLKSTGTYTYSTTTTCGGNGPLPAIALAYATVNMTPQAVAYTLNGNQLVLDYGGPCDAPVDTYERVE
ncbi:lipocalin family protein [Hymenobacter rubidus]|uniref:lipocalin family protein n=1 Tax=Hymenobacter rubidus TaxID=1441626 RepID=UPI00191E146C|nr:lipocalin family protein [Hymenobacter rubidus]